ncbi:hypothetical protein HDU88_002061 [Geranomyces variabilis]|nr:hypothetical protein HDU88_002061 [Geranomyces variabilis]
MSISANLLQLVRRGDDETAASDRMVSSFAGTATPKDSFFVHNRPYEQYDSVKSEWIAVTALLFLWLVTLLARQIAMMVDVRARMRHEQESGETTERQPLLSSNLKDRAGEWAPKFDRAADALRVTLLMLLAATIFVSIPMPYTCQLESPHNPGFPTPPETECTVCFANGTTLGTSIISWVFTALSLLWLVMELAVVDNVSASIARTFVSVASFPLILTIFVIGFKEWSKINARADQTCN